LTSLTATSAARHRHVFFLGTLSLTRVCLSLQFRFLRLPSILSSLSAEPPNGPQCGAGLAHRSQRTASKPRHFIWAWLHPPSTRCDGGYPIRVGHLPDRYRAFVSGPPLGFLGMQARWPTIWPGPGAGTHAVGESKQPPRDETTSEGSELIG
jgi:hypothetical protein